MSKEIDRRYGWLVSSLLNIILDEELKVISYSAPLFNPWCQLFTPIPTFSRNPNFFSSTHSSGRPCDLKALFAPEILVKSCGFLMSDLCLSCWTGQAAGSLFILPIFVSPHQQRTRCKFVTFLNIESFISSSEVHFSPMIAIFLSWFQSGDTGDGFWFCNFWRFPFASSLILLHMQNALIFHLSKKKWLKPGEQISMWWWPFRPSLKIDFFFSQNIWLNIWTLEQLTGHLDIWTFHWTFEHSFKLPQRGNPQCNTDHLL